MGDFLLSLTLITKGENLRIAVAAECGAVRRRPYRESRGV